ncbi:hypothetical protein M8C21_000592, partial [Ambrosia artemisiifolia]
MEAKDSDQISSEAKDMEGVSLPQKRCLYNSTDTIQDSLRPIKKPRKISDETRTRFQQFLDEFHKSNDEEYTFEPSLSRYERAEVHKLWRAMGANRCLTLYKLKVEGQTKTKTKKRTETKTKTKTKPKPKPKPKPKTKPKTKTKPKAKSTEVKRPITPFAFSEEGKTVLRDFFSFYPPGDNGEAEKVAVTSSKNPDKIPLRTDDMFSKAPTTKVKIAKKLKAVVARIQSDVKLKQITEDRSKLPIASFKDVIISTVESNQLVLISGETGCGKTTQVPQYLLDYMWSKGEECKIVCTQPRRISAVSVSERIATERGEPIGQSVGYKIRMDKKGGRNSSIVFCTNGVLLRILVRTGNSLATKEKSAKMVKDAFPDITHIIVDEIHERDRFSDFMLTII